MSGGHFDYDQYKIGQIADGIEQLIIDNNSTEDDRYGFQKGRFYSEETIVEFKDGITFLRLAEIYAQRIDWLVSGDDGEKTFHERLRNDLDKFQRSK